MGGIPLAATIFGQTSTGTPLSGAKRVASWNALNLKLVELKRNFSLGLSN